MVVLAGMRRSFPVRSPVVCASAPVWPARWCSTRRSLLCDEPDSGLDPVRTAYLSQLLIDINAQIDCTILIVTHNINIARTVAGQHGHVVPPQAGHVRPA